MEFALLYEFGVCFCDNMTHFRLNWLPELATGGPGPAAEDPAEASALEIDGPAPPGVEHEEVLKVHRFTSQY